MAEITTREMLNSVIANEITDEVIEKAKKCLESLDKRNAKRKSTPSKTTLENLEVKKSIMAFLEGKDFVLGTEIADELGYTKNKISSLCSRMVKEDKTLIESEVTVKGKGKRKAYKLA